MEHVSLEIALLTMIGIYLFSELIQKYTKFPLPHSMLILSYGVHRTFPDLLNIHAVEHFDKIIFFLIPLIFLYDATHLKWKDIKTYSWSIAYLAIVSVGLSIVLGASLYYFGVFGTGLTIGAYVALFAMNMATDAISVSNIFSQFKGIPHNIKVLVEGESLGNDATAIIAFYFVGVPWITYNTFDLSTLPIIAIKVFVLSGLIGLAFGLVGFYLLKLFDDMKHEFLIKISVVVGAFTAAELVHLAGIFSLITAAILFITLIEREHSEENKAILISPENTKGLLKFLKKETTTQTNYKASMDFLEVISSFAVVLVFVSLAGLIDFELLYKYRVEIFIMFFATTVIRGAVMAKFVLIGKNVKAIDYVGFDGWLILTLAGIKGALSIIMLHSLPETFKFYEMFESVTIGVILLSIFIYGLSLLFFMLYKEKQSV